MQSVLRCVTLFIILAFAVCFDSEESNESREGTILSRQRAHAYFNRYPFRMKSLAERQSETCEVYFHCRLMARYYGSQTAYNRYFGQRQGNNNVWPY